MQPKTILFDFDDTLIDTHPVFTEATSEVKHTLSNFLNIPYEEVSKVFEESLVKAYHEVSINPVKEWPTTIQNMRDHFDIPNDLAVKIIDRMYKVYTTPPKLLEGSLEVLEHFKKDGYKLGLVTHAVEDWTHLKLSTHNLRQYFDHIEIADMNRHKSKEDWLKAIKALDTHPEKVAIVGDNVSGDIKAGYDVGVRKLIWLQKTQGWSVYTSGTLPEGTITIRNIKEVIEVLKQKSKDKKD